MHDGLLTAESAPTGVQLWPTGLPQQGRNFTLTQVACVLGDGGWYVRWTYQNDSTRDFSLGERVAVRVPDQELLADSDVEWI
ncbi:hypothetical protein AB0A95_33440 [Micromonospora sp. NPDC049230]|uniref:hypothetical protein n=1 Tax=Micromonospora sp. NPDC049230 TaxID=3155502 RepID=UPI0034062FAA